jgi:hypothetical protein
VGAWIGIALLADQRCTGLNRYWLFVMMKTFIKAKYTGMMKSLTIQEYTEGPITTNMRDYRHIDPEKKACFIKLKTFCGIKWEVS